MSPHVIESYPLTEAKDKFSALTAKANATGTPFRVLKGGHPWVIVTPVSTAGGTRGEVAIQPIRRAVPVADLDALFAGYEGSFEPTEDGFASPSGCEET